MAIRKVEDFTRTLPVTSSLRLYSVMYDWDKEKFLNVFRSYELNPDLEKNLHLYDIYTVDENDWWENISSRFYGSQYLWWVLPVINNIDNPFEGLEPGMQLKILRYELLHIIFDDMFELERL